jgi:imidazoleglycerol phosphate synthase glutamine amidotransferase subunit HisH
MHDPIKNYDIKIIDMGWGNLEALKFFLLRLGGSVEIITISDYLAGETKKIIAVIPGIGSASDLKTN